MRGRNRSAMRESKVRRRTLLGNEECGTLKCYAWLEVTPVRPARRWTKLAGCKAPKDGPPAHLLRGTTSDPTIGS